MIKVISDIFAPSNDESQLREFKALYKEQKDFVRSSLYWMIRKPEIIDELVQEVFLKAWKNFSKFKANSSFKTWIYRIAMNSAYDYLKRNKENLELKNEIPFQDQKELKDLISKGLLKLSLEHREVFILFYKMEHTQKEISDLLSIPEGTVKSRIYNAKKNFTDFLSDNGVTA